MQIVYLHEGNSNGAVYTAHNSGVVTRWQVPNDRRFPRVTRSPTTIHYVLDLVLSDNPADDRSLPVIIGSNQSSVAVVQFQCGILQWIGNAKRTELRANGAYDHSLCSRALDNETTNHHVVPGLNKAASADIAEHCPRCRARRWCSSWRRWCTCHRHRAWHSERAMPGGAIRQGSFGIEGGAAR